MFYTYILVSRRNGTIYVGSTDGLVNRVVEHRKKVRQGFTARYGVTRLVWYEPHVRVRRRSDASAASRNGADPGRSC